MFSLIQFSLSPLIITYTHNEKLIYGNCQSRLEHRSSSQWIHSAFNTRLMTERYHFYSNRCSHKHHKVGAHISRNHSYGNSESKREKWSKHQNELKIILHIYKRRTNRNKKNFVVFLQENYQIIINWLMFKWEKVLTFLIFIAKSTGNL